MNNLARLATVTVLVQLMTGLAIAAPTELGPVVVTATRSEGSGIPIPAGITVVSRAEIEASGARSLADLLRTRAGVHVSDLYGDGTSATIDMRGFGATANSNTLVLVDGRPLNNASDIGGLDLSLVNLDNVERVEIVQGSAGTLYGNQAVGGLIHIVTRGTPGRFEAKIGAEYASYDDRRLAAQVGQRYENGFAFSLRGRMRDSDNYRDHNDTTLNQAELRLEQTLPRGLLFVEYDDADEEVQLPGALFKDELKADRRQSIPVYAEDFSETRTVTSRVGFAHALSVNWRFEAEAIRRENDREFITSFRFSPGTLSTQQREITTFNPRVHGTTSCGSGQCQFTLGVDQEHTEYRLLTSFGPQNVDQKISGLYGQAVIPLGTTFSATLGARHAEVTNDISTGTATQLDDSVDVGSLGFSWQPEANWRVFARADQNFRFAKVDEHTNPVFGQPVGLNNQTGVSYELGAEYSRGARLAKAVLYELELDDEIAFDATGFSNVNLSKTHRHGLMLDGSWPLAPAWSLHGAYTWTEGTITAGPHEGNRIPLVPQSQARLAADWRMAADWTLRMEGQWVGEQVTGSDFANTFPELPAYAVANLSLRFQHQDLELGMQVNNLLDHEYSETGAVGLDASFTARDAFYPAPERNLRVTLRYTWH
jgi:iron complex outermembrane receptor protein